MTAKIKSLQTYTDCVRAANDLNGIVMQLERFSEWHCQFYFEEKDYENYIDEAKKLIEEFAKRFEELAQEEIAKGSKIKVEYEWNPTQIRDLAKEEVEEIIQGDVINVSNAVAIAKEKGL